MKLSSGRIKKFLICSQKKAFLLFRKTEILKKFLKFQETEIFYILGDENPEKLLIFQDVTLPARKIKRTHSEKMPYISGIGTF